MPTLRELIAEFGIEVDDTQLKKAGTFLDQFKSKLKEVGDHPLMLKAEKAGSVDEFIKNRMGADRDAAFFAKHIKASSEEAGKAVKDNLGTGSDAQASIGDFIGQLKMVAQATALFFAGRAVANMVHGSIEAASHINDLSEQLNVGTTALQEWIFAAELAGAESQDVAASLSYLQRAAAEVARDGTGKLNEQGKAFKELGVAVKDTGGNFRSNGDIFSDVADALVKVENPTRRAALATAVLGKGSKALLPLFSKGAEGLAEFKNEVHAVGAAMTEDMIKQADEAGDNIDRFSKALEGVKTAIVNQVLPSISRGTEWLTKLIKKFRESPAAIAVLKTALVTVSALIAGSLYKSLAKLVISFAPVIGTTLLWAAGLAALVLIIQDVYTYLNGGQSVFGSWIEWLDQLIDRVGWLAPGLKLLAEAGRAIGDSLGGVSDEDNQAQTNKFLEEARARERARASGQSVQQNVIAKSGNRANIAVPGAQSNSVATSINAPVTINAPGGNPIEIRKELEKHLGNLMRNAQATLPQGAQ